MDEEGLSRYPAPTREHHDDVCTTEDLTVVRGVTGRPVKPHRTYELALWDGRILRTRISKPIDSTTYGARMWAHILRQQLTVSQDEFLGLRSPLDEARPSRPRQVASRAALPLHMYRLLVQIGATDEEIAQLDPASAAPRIAAFYSRGPEA